MKTNSAFYSHFGGKKNMRNIIVVEEKSSNEFQYEVNKLLAEGYRIMNANCGEKYSAILITH